MLYLLVTEKLNPVSRDPLMRKPFIILIILSFSRAKLVWHDRDGGEEFM